VERNEFSIIRQYLGKSQNQLAQLLCVSPKAIQSFEQGWRSIPASAERQLLFLLASKMSKDENINPCWETQKCPVEWRKKCAAWELKAGHFCWFINGTFCQGKLQGSWGEKIEQCRQCNMLKSILPSLE
jgi:DNA-binding XRE family transcriptional regulator